MHKREVHDRATNVFKVEDGFCTLTGVKVWPDGLGGRETDGLIGTMEATGNLQTTVPLSLLPKSQIYSVRVRSYFWQEMMKPIRLGFSVTPSFHCRADAFMVDSVVGRQVA